MIFGFFLRFFASFVAAKILLRALEADSMGYLLGLSFLFTLNLYWFDFSKYGARFCQDWQKEVCEEKDKADGRPLLLPPSKADS
ncbi:MAG: hypothetical protein FJ135_02895 [Deltaproteobacteria bacterium]|nr:hypothetical protein [Deltaproteobacteria bacterium]